MVLTARLVLVSGAGRRNQLAQHDPVQHHTGFGEGGIGTKILLGCQEVQGRVRDEVGATAVEQA
jgi:hypothetical protein